MGRSIQEKRENCAVGHKEPDKFRDLFQQGSNFSINWLPKSQESRDSERRTKEADM
jgi:hypothetical protein